MDPSTQCVIFHAPIKDRLETKHPSHHPSCHAFGLRFEGSSSLTDTFQIQRIDGGMDPLLAYTLAWTPIYPFIHFISIPMGSGKTVLETTVYPNLH